MNEQAFIDLISGRQQGTLPSLARFGLRCLSPIYAGATHLRNAGYEFGVSTSQQVDVPVISVGNITTGGTGKTPVVAFITNQLVQDGHQPCILSRGYRSLDDAGNDEKRLLDRLCPGVPHLQDPDRVTSAQQAIQQYGATVLVLDDGFQHRRLARDLDIVLIDATNPFGHEYVLPRGLLREPLNGLHRAHVLGITRCDLVSPPELDAIREALAPFEKPVVEIAFEPTCLVDQSGERHTFAAAQGRAGAFCGIGNPDAFRRTLQSLELESAFFEAFADHCEYDAAEMHRLQLLVRDYQPACVLCTEKDLVKIDASRLDVALFAIRVECSIRSNSVALVSSVETALA